MVGRLVETLLEDLTGLLGQTGEIAQEAKAHVLLVEERQLAHERGGEQMHEEVDLVLRALPVLRGERIAGEHVDAEPHAGRDRLAQALDAGDVALAALEALARGPAAVAVHDDGDVTRETVEVDVGKRHVLGRVGKVWAELLLVALHVCLHVVVAALRVSL